MPGYCQANLYSFYTKNKDSGDSALNVAYGSLNKDRVLRNFNKVIPGPVHPQIHGNVLWVNKPKFLGSILLKTKNYQIADYNLFYENIRETAGARIKVFLKTGL